MLLECKAFLKLAASITNTFYPRMHSSISHKITEYLRLQGTSGGHLVHLLCQISNQIVPLIATLLAWLFIQFSMNLSAHPDHTSSASL